MSQAFKGGPREMDNVPTNQVSIEAMEEAHDFQY